MRATIKKYFLAGLMVWLPVWITVLVIRFVIELFDQTLTVLPVTWHPDYWMGWHIPAVGLLFSLFILLLTGLLVSNFLGSRVVKFSERIFARIPLVRSIYSASKQVMDTVLSNSGQSFRKVFLLEYPRLGIWTLVFQTAEQVAFTTPLGLDLCAVYVPTTPNPTSGFTLLVPKTALQPIELSVDEALRMILSLGVVQIPGKENNSSVSKNS
jgi:uncharacterized membrane protein